MNRVIETAARCCEQAYYSNPRIADFLPKDVSTYTQFNVLMNGQSVTIYDTSLYRNDIARYQKTYIVAFRGTDDHIDWATNLSMIKQVVDKPEGLTDDVLSNISKRVPFYCIYDKPRLHTGFLKAYNSLKGDIHKYFSECHEKGLLKDSKIILTGHSLGGALSTVCSYDIYNFRKKYHTDISVITFGSPRVCNLYASVLLNEMYKNNSIRVVNGMDPITLTPLINSWHCFQLANIYEKTYWKSFVSLLWLPRVSIHMTGNYISNLPKLLQNVSSKFGGE